MQSNKNPFNVKFLSIVITKFNGTDKLDITPQVLEFTLFQSIFSPLLRADMALSDYIGLMNNYPLSGEEVVEVVIEQAGNSEGTVKKIKKTLRFVITGIKDINFSDDARQMVYNIELASVEAFMNAKTRVSHAYNKTIEEMIKLVFDEYVKSTKTINFYQATSKIRKLVIPNLKPLDAISWLCKFAVAENPSSYHTFAFFESLDEFVFKSLQKPTFRGAVDNNAYQNSMKEKYYYISNLELLMNNKEMYDKYIADGFNENRTINDLKINKRYTTLEKIVGGYFENEFVEVNMLQKDHLITKTNLVAKTDPRSRSQFVGFQTLVGGGLLNTSDYIENIQKEYTEDETSSRIKYIINNYDNINQPSFRDKFGYSSRSFLAFQQIDLSIAVHSNLENRVGDLMYLQIPEMHSFNISDKPDKYLSGYFIASEIKTVMRNGGYSQSYVRLNKDSFSSKLQEKSEYNLSATIDRSQDRVLNKASGV